MRHKIAEAIIENIRLKYGDKTLRAVIEELKRKPDNVKRDQPHRLLAGDRQTEVALD